MLDWSRRGEPAHQQWLDFYRMLLDIRRREIVPLLAGGARPIARWRALGETALDVEWDFPGRGVLRMLLNVGARPAPRPGPDPPWGRCLCAVGQRAGEPALPPWSVECYTRPTGVREDACRR